MDAGVARATETGLTFSAYGLETPGAAGDRAVRDAATGTAAWRRPSWPATPRRTSCWPGWPPPRSTSRSAAGCPTAIERVAQLRGAWSQDVSLALVAGGCEADLLRWRGDLDGAADAAERAIDYVTPALGQVVSRRHLAVRARAGRAGRPGRGRAAARRRRGGRGDRTRAVEELIERGRGRRPSGAGRGTGGSARRGWPGWPGPRPSGPGWPGRSDPDRWREALRIFGYGYPYEQARCRWRLAEALLVADRREEAAAEVAAAHEIAVRLGAAPLKEALEALARRGRLEAGLPVPVPGGRR